MNNPIKNISGHEIVYPCKCDNNAVDHFFKRQGRNKPSVIITTGTRCIHHNKEKRDNPGTRNVLIFHADDTTS